MQIEKPEQLLREFNRLHTQAWRLLDSTYLNSPYSLTEARIMFELEAEEVVTLTSLTEKLALDKGYLSRLVANFVKRKLVQLKPSDKDGRSRIIVLTKKGMDELKSLQALATTQAKEFIEAIPSDRRTDVLGAFRKLRDQMRYSENHVKGRNIMFKDFGSGDLGRVLEHHASLYKQELGWGIEFEGYVAETLAVFARNFDQDKENIWIAEEDGKFLGSVGIVKVSSATSQLRWLLLDPDARGLGLGQKLIEQALEFSKKKKYREVILWTEKTREAARNLYKKYGFELVETKRTKTFGASVVEEKWVLKLK